MMSRSSYLYKAPHQGIGEASYQNRMAKERGEASERQRQATFGSNPYDFGPMQPERSQLAKMADQATMGQPVNLNEAERLQKAAIDRQLIEQGQRQKAIDEAIGAPGPRLDALSRGRPSGYKASFAPKEKTQWDPFNNPEMRGMTGMEKRAARLAEGGLVRDETPLPGYAMGGPVMRDYGMGGPGGRDYGMGGAGGRDYGMGGPGGRDYGMGGAGMRGYAMGGLVKGGLGQAMPNGRFMSPQMLAPRYAEGGPVEGPGGPKDDLINAKLSDGEFVMPSEVVEFYGLDRLHKMMAKAKEGLNEIKPAPQALPTPLPVTMPQPTPAFAYGGMATRDPLPGYKLGGQFDEEESPTDAMDPLPQAIAAQQRAVEANQNPSFLDYYFPTEGVEASQAASSATQRATDSLGRFFEAEAAATAADLQRMAETRRQQDALMNYAPGSPAPRPAPSPLPEFLGRAAPLFPQGRPVSPSPATPMMAPAVSPSPSPQVSPSPSPQVSPSPTPQVPAPAMANGRQPQPVLSSPMDTNKPERMPSGSRRPAFLSPAEKDAQEKEKWSAYGANRVAPAGFEVALTGLTGMQKRNARRALAMEEATFQRNQGRAAIEQAQKDERASQERALNFEEWKQKRVIDSQFDMAARNQAIGENAALGAATTREAREYEEAQNRRKQEEQSKKAKNFTPIPDTDYLINDLGNLISKKTNKPVGLSPEEAQKYGLVIIGADSDGRVRYGPPKVVEPTEDYIDPVSGDVLKLKPGQVLPEGTPYKPLTPNAAPAPASGATPPVAVKTEDEWKALKPGTRYVDSNGTVSIKK